MALRPLLPASRGRGHSVANSAPHAAGLLGRPALFVLLIAAVALAGPGAAAAAAKGKATGKKAAILKARPSPDALYWDLPGAP